MDTNKNSIVQNNFKDQINFFFLITILIYIDI